MDSFAENIFQLLEESGGRSETPVDEPNVETITVRPDDRRFDLRTPEVNYPVDLQLPSAELRRKAPWEEFAQAYGIRYNPRDTIGQIEATIVGHLRSLDYYQDPEPQNRTIYHRDAPVRIVRESRPQSIVSGQTEVRIAGQDDPLFSIYGSEVTYPQEITIPTGNRRAPYEEFIRQYGIRTHTGMTIRHMNDRIIRQLTDLGYRQEHGNVYRRNAPLRVIRESPNPGLVPTSELPAMIPMNTFRTIATMTDFVNRHGLAASVESNRGKNTLYQELNQYLIRRGYIFDSGQQALVRSGPEESGNQGPQIGTYYDLPSIISPEIVLREVQSTDPVIISQATLMTLALTEEELRQRIGGWTDLNGTLDRIQTTFGITPTVSLVILINYLLERMNTTAIAEIHRSLNLEPSRNRVNDIQMLFRRRITVEPKTYNQRSGQPTGPIPGDLEHALTQGYDIKSDPNLMDALAQMVGLPIRNRFVPYWAQLLRLYPDIARGFFPADQSTSITDSFSYNSFDVWNSGYKSS